MKSFNTLAIIFTIAIWINYQIFPAPGMMNRTIVSYALICYGMGCIVAAFTCLVWRRFIDPVGLERSVQTFFENIPARVQWWLRL